jgi:hypothetical protein
LSGETQFSRILFRKKFPYGQGGALAGVGGKTEKMAGKMIY